jgi:hypothetical protein
MSNGFKPSFVAAKLYRKKSEKTGATYFTGRMGGVRVALMKARDQAEGADEVWELLFSEAPPYKPRDAGTEDEGQP